MTNLSKNKRSILAGKIARATGIAKYAITDKMDDEELVKASENLEILSIIKKANNYNRYKQGLLTEEANKTTEVFKAENETLKAKLQDTVKQLLQLENSEILRLGVWLADSLKLSGKERQQALKEKDLVHNDDYKNSVEDLTDTIQEQRRISKQESLTSGDTIKEMERKIDNLRRQLSLVQDYIVNNEGKQKWQEIAKYIGNKL